MPADEPIQSADTADRPSTVPWPPIVLVGPDIRATLKQLTAARLPRLTVLSYNEITRDTDVESVSLVGEPQPAG